MSYFYDQELTDISIIVESAYRTPTGGAKDTAITAGTTTYALPMIIKSADITLPIRVREEIHGIGSGKYPSKIINKMNEPIDISLEGDIQIGTFLAYALGIAYTSTAAQAEVSIIDCLAKASITNETYFTIYDGTDDYHVWFDVAGDDTWTADPTGQSGTLKADISGATTAAQVAVIVAAAINGDAKFGATSSGARVTVTTADSEAATDLHDVNCGLKMFVQKQGVPNTSYAHRIIEAKTYALQSFTLHVEQRNTTGAQNIIYDLFGCVVDTFEISTNKDDGTVKCSVGIKATGFAAGTAQTAPPSELTAEPFVWSNLDNSDTTATYVLLDENSTERAPDSIESISLSISNNVEFAPAIGDPIGSFAISKKREIELKITGFIQDKTLYDYWRGTFDNVNKRMNSATTKLSALIRLIKTAGTDLITIYIANLYIQDHSCHIQTIDEAIKGVDLVFRAAQPDVDGRQIYSTIIDSNTKVYYHNTDES